jgi:hypothetical protein
MLLDGCMSVLISISTYCLAGSSAGPVLIWIALSTDSVFPSEHPLLPLNPKPLRQDDLYLIKLG